MERRFEVRKRELLAECTVSPEHLSGWQQRLQAFSQPFLALLARSEQREHGERYLTGLLSEIQCKNVESIAYLHDQDRRCLQSFIGHSPWDWRPWHDELVEQVGRTLGESDGVLVFDPSAFPKSGQDSVGVARQWCGRLGKVDNCQLAVYMGYVSRAEHVLVDSRLFLPKAWTKDKSRRKKAGIPHNVRFRTRHQLVLEMFEAHGPRLPHAWVTGDDEMGRPTWFRRRLDSMQERYLLAVPSNTTVRDLDALAPPGGRGNPPKRPFEQVRYWAAALPAEAWKRIDVRDGHRGPLVAEAVKTRAVAKTDKRRIGPEEMLVVLRTIEEGTVKYDYYLSNADPHTPLEEFARVAKAEHRVEECLQRGKSEAGLADYEVRNWVGWHHHQALSLIATWFLIQEARRGKKYYACADGSSSPHRTGPGNPSSLRVRPTQPRGAPTNPTLAAHQPGKVLPLEKTQLVGTFAN